MTHGSHVLRRAGLAVRELMLRFDAAYPALADAIGAVVRSLARIGI